MDAIYISTATFHPPSNVTMATSKDLPDILSKVFKYNPRPITPPPSYHSNQPQFHRTLPFNFYDRHLAPQLSLKQVVVEPSIPTSLSGNIDATLEHLQSSGHQFIPLIFETVGDCTHPTFTAEDRLLGEATMERLASRYHRSVGSVATAFISRWAIHPAAPKYYSTLTFWNRESDLPAYEDAVYSRESLRFHLFENQRAEVLSSISDQLKDALRSLEYKDLIIYQFYEMSAQMEQIFKDMDSLEADLPSPEYKTRGLAERRTECRPPPRDATSAPWSLARCHIKCTKESAITLEIGEDEVVPRLHDDQTKFNRMDSLSAAGLCYHAWHQAVAEDATIIVFHCGNYERIGIRHRATQTLILSKLIEVSKCQDPAYGKIHVGLMLAAVKDTLDRHWQSYRPQPVPVSVPGKRKRVTYKPTELRRSKRQQVKVQMASLSPAQVKDEKTFWKAYTDCRIALVSFDLDVLRSPCPAACLRHEGPLSPHGIEMGTIIWRPSYKPLECCTITLDSNLSRGGTGLVHSARLEVRTAGGTTHSMDVVVKSAVDPHLRNRIRREYRIYRRLWEHKVERIPIVYGLFEDIHNMVTLLVLEKFAMTFRDREPFDLEGKGMMLSVSRAERALCLKTVRAMHKAGVAHLDLRAENIMVGHDGLPVIIDFDSSWEGAQKSVTDKEIGYLQEVLDGKVQDGFPIQLDSDEE
ncbi:hypothetical protein BDN72DRAFT_960745 [Pluteus cervinus]|uniref:Uncharacterized protein n=1 Tax=Pluteus cervinus TaxID=181527 RepID=A0ACD3AQ27_9AGAR|nr:hypothetical protein BDN72DRAFT_960745 [Pluteus cervinus]